ncbi:MAG: hypothetical protein U0T77_11240 [Chitinophagales bacterium]
MKKNFFFSICVMLVMASCQKESAQLATNPTPKVAQATTQAPNGVSMIKDGTPYSTVLQSNGSEIGWSLNLKTIEQNALSDKGPVSNMGDASLYCGGINTVQLLAGQNIPMGVLAYANDGSNLYVTYLANSDWYMTEVHLYVGSLSGVPKSGGGTPSPGRFPLKQTFSSSNLAQEITWTIPLSQIGFEFTIAAHASVLRVDIDGDVVAKETAWASGTRFQSNKNWATYVTGYVSNCDGGGSPSDATKGGTAN